VAMAAYITSPNQTYNWFYPNQIGYSFGNTASNPVNTYLYVLKGVATAGLIKYNNNQYNAVAYAWSITDTLGTNSFTIEPITKTENNVYTYQVIFTATTAILEGATLSIFPRVTKAYV